MEYFEKITEKPAEDLSWNIPEKKSGVVNIIGGNSQNFRTEIKVSEFLEKKYPIESIRTVLPDALKTKLPNLDNFTFLSSTESGSFKSAGELLEIFNTGDFNLLIGDFSKNKITGRALASACANSEKPLFLTRDTVDLLAEENLEDILLKPDIYFFLSMPQLQKLLHAIYYPKMLTLSMSLTQILEVLHKFTLSYPTNIITLCNGQILIAQNGKVVAVPLEKTGYSPIMIWSEEFVSKILALNLYNPDNFIKASVAGIFN